MIMHIKNLPRRPLYLHEITALKQNSNKIKNAEALFYEENNINGVICFFLNINNKAHILGYDNEEWINISKITQDDDYNEETNSVLSWMNEKHTNYGIYGEEEL